MSSQPVYFDLADTADERFDRPIEWLLVVLLAFAPLALGAVQPWSEAVVIALSIAMLLLLMVKLLLRPDIRLVWTWAYVPMIGFVALVLLQLVPLPASVMRVISPNTFALRAQLLSDLPGGADQLAWMPLSFYPEATVGQLRLLLVACAAFVVALNVVRRISQIRQMLAACAIIGGGVALLALIQNITDATKIYWLIPIYKNEATSGPFINQSNFAQFMNLSIGAVLALLMMNLDQLPRHRHHHSVRAAALARPVTRSTWMLACAMVAMGVAVPVSDSRMGMAAMVIAGLFSAGVLARRRRTRSRAWIFVGIALVVFAAMLLLRWEPLIRRIASLGEADALGGRLDILRGAMEIFKRFAIFGTGLGTFSIVFPGFDPSSIVKIAEHAENEYAQTLVETGAAGLLFALAFLVIVWIAYARCVRGAPSPMASGAIGLGFGLLAILVHSLTDFAQHLPAVFILTALTCAMLVNLSQAARHGHALAERTVPRAARWPRAAGALVALLAGAWVMTGALDVWRADLKHRAAERIADRLAAQNWNGSDIEFAGLIKAAQTASRIRPRNAEFRFDLNLYRFKALARRTDVTGWSDAGRRDVRRVARELLEAARHCPTYSATYLLAGQLHKYVLEEESAAALIRRAHRLAPNNPHACLEVAVLEAEQSRWDEAMALLRRAIAVQPDYYREPIDALAVQLARPDLALQLVQDDLESLRYLSRKLSEIGSAPAMAAIAQARAEQLVFERAARPDASAAALAEAAYLSLQREDHPAAVDLFRRALIADYTQTQWRLDLARTLLALGQTEQAINEARTVLRIAPADRAAAKLIADHTAALRAEETLSPSTTAPATSPAHGFRFD